MKSLLLFLFLLITAVSVFAQPGTLDPSFGEKGIVVDKNPLNTIGETIKITKEGRILIGTSGPYKGIAHAFRIDALLPDGSPDLSFGEKGSAHVLFEGMTQPYDIAGVSSLILLPDGKILAGGGLTATGNKDQNALARFNPNGTPDSTFGTNGTTTASFGYIVEGVGPMQLQPDGKIVTCGCVTTGDIANIDTYSDHVSAARYLPDGSRDLSFGNKGIVVSNTTGCAYASALQKDGKIVAAGYRGVSNDNTDDARFHLERYNEDGSYDKSFGIDGAVNVQAGTGGGHINDVVIQEDGRIVVTGTSAQPFDLKLTVARFNVDGSFDKSFGEGGVVVTNFPQYNGAGMKVFITGQKGDKIVVAGTNYNMLESNATFAMVGYNIDGSLDPDFGNSGIQRTTISGVDYVSTADIQADGKIVELGYSYALPTFTSSRALARYNGYPTQVPLYVKVKRWLQNHGISWKGLPRDNIAYYSIERSTNSKIDFTQIAKVSGVNNLNQYSFTNSNLLQGNNYYRIKAVSGDGAIRYSEVASADNTAATAFVYPNPVRDYVNVQGLKTGEQASISIANGSGTLLAKGASNGNTQYRALATSLQPGTYYLNITTGSKTETLKFMKE